MALQNIKAKKSLGQNFLIDNTVIDRIVEFSGANKETDVLEIGPGLGAVTELLIDKARNLTAVEIDDRLFNELSKKFGNRENFKIIHQDILTTDIKSLITDHTIVVANLPYYITTPIITMLIENEYNIKSMTVMVQLEVAKRICANEFSRDYSAISVLCNYHCDTELLFVVPPEAFNPIPKVHSAVIKLTFLEKKRVLPDNEKKFFSVVKSAFSNRRKTLANCLMNSFSLKREEVNTILEKCDIDLMARGETLSLEKFKNISNAL
jgi:16S rRNA (adenine1518-N6/adenine1519-N6)-dimethyltransferase